MSRAVIALGSNLGNRVELLDEACEALASTPGIELRAVSGLVESIAHTADGVDSDAPRYVNGVALIDTSLDAVELLERLRAVEQRFGRPAERARWSERTLDLDLIDFEAQQLQTERLTLPHPRAHQRVFVLAPWLELDPEAQLPGCGAVRELLERCDPAELLALRPARGGS